MTKSKPRSYAKNIPFSVIKSDSRWLTEDAAIARIKQFLDETGMGKDIDFSISNILKENRRHTEQLLPDGTVKPRGNRWRYGFLPFFKSKSRIYYWQGDIDYFITYSIVPYLSMTEIIAEAA